MSDGAAPARSRVHGIRLTIAALALAAAIAVSTLASLTLRFGWAFGPQPVTVAAIFGAGAGIGFPVAVLLAGMIAPRASRHWRAIITLGFALVTIVGATLAIYFLEHRAYYSQWHGPALSRVWLLQQVFTALGAAAQIGVMGTRYLGLPALALVALASWWTHRNAD